MALGKRRDEQQEMWVATTSLPKSQGHVFYRKLNAVFAEAGFDRMAEELGRPYYHERIGRPSIPPGVYFRMLLVGYFEGLSSQRGIAWRCADSLSLREFLGVPLTEDTPDHSSLTRVRDRLPLEVHTAVFDWALRLLAEKGLMPGKTVAIDSTFLEANAAMKSIVRRDTGEDWNDYLRRLMQEREGVENPTDEELRRFDRTRKDKRVSNEEWGSKTDPESRIAKMKNGETHLAYKAEHVIDLETEVVLAASIRHADEADTDTMVDSLIEAQLAARAGKAAKALLDCGAGAEPGPAHAQGVRNRHAARPPGRPRPCGPCAVCPDSHSSSVASLESAPIVPLPRRIVVCNRRVVPGESPTFGLFQRAAKANYTATVPTGGTTTVVEGAVPTRALSLPDEFMYDGFGRKFGYSVWAPMTAPQSFINYGIVPNCGEITVKGATPRIRTSRAIYSLISYGLNGHGGYNAQGTRTNTGSVNTDEQANCHCDSSAHDTLYSGTYVQKDRTEDPTNYLDTFDDIVRYKERWQMQSFNDQYYPGGNLVCPGNPGFRIDGAASNDEIGFPVIVGDVNGDGIPDLIIAAPFNGSWGSIYVVYGTALGFPNPLPLTSLNGTNGFRIDGNSTTNNIGLTIATGDINGDGIADVIIGASATNGGKGSVFVVYGTSASMPTVFDLTTLNGTNGFRIDSTTAGESIGLSLATGDINGDGIADIITGQNGSGVVTGGTHVYVVFGSKSFSLSRYTLDNDGTTGLIDNNAAKGFRIDGVNAGDTTASSLATGDINGDGIADIIIGSPGVTTATYVNGVLTQHPGAGEVEVIFGKVSGWKTPFSH